MTTIMITAGSDPLKATGASSPTLSGGTVTVSDPLIQATSAVSPTGLGILNLGTLTVTINPGVGYTIKSSNILDARNLSVGIIY